MDIQFLSIRAGQVMAAVDLPLLPVPLSLPVDICNFFYYAFRCLQVRWVGAAL